MTNLEEKYFAVEQLQFKLFSHVAQRSNYMIEICLTDLHHRGGDCIGLFFPFNKKLVALVKAIPGSKFSATHRCWYVPGRTGVVEDIADRLKDQAILNISKLSDRWLKIDDNEKRLEEEENTLLRIIEKKLKLRGYSESTIRTYIQQFKLFVRFYRPASVSDLTESEIRNYMLYLVEKRKLSRSTQNQAINAIKFFFEKVLGEERRVYHLERPMKEKTLPTVLSEQEIQNIFSVITNVKHRLMMMLIYSSGLRRSEQKSVLYEIRVKK
jgi:hypothetical protein